MRIFSIEKVAQLKQFLSTSSLIFPSFQHDPIIFDTVKFPQIIALTANLRSHACKQQKQRGRYKFIYLVTAPKDPNAGVTFQCKDFLDVIHQAVFFF